MLVGISSLYRTFFQLEFACIGSSMQDGHASKGHGTPSRPRSLFAVQPLRVTLVQNDAGPEPAQNLTAVREALASVGETDLIALPEIFALRGSDADFRERAETIPGATTQFLTALAREKGAWVLGGSIVERDGRAVFNTSVLVNRNGELAATYRKIHLFEAHLETGQTIRESDVFQSGDAPQLAEVEGWRCGLSICYDLRFPELYRHYTARGAHILLAPSNFTQRTGRDHWRILNRARAIENQCFVVAPAQCGTNVKTGITSYGHSLVVGPWGEVVAELGTEVGVVTVELLPERLAAIRRRIPVLEHRCL